MKALLSLVATVVLAASQAPASAPRPQVLGIAHVSIQTTDMRAARAFYGGVLGFPERGPQRPDVAIFVVNARQRLVVRDGLPADRDERFMHVAFETDVAAMRQFLLGRSIQTDAPRQGADEGGRYITTTDADGHAIRFVEMGSAVPDAPGTADRRISRRILHAGLTVKDAAAADRFYKEALGFAETWRGGRPEGTTSWINMRVPDGTDYLEYMLYPAAPPDRRQLGSAHHVALLVTDIQQALETVRARTKPDDRNHRANPSIGVNNRWQLNVFDPDGTRVEFMEPWTVR